MKRALSFTLLFVLLVGAAASASPVTVYEFKAARNNVLGEPVTIRLVNRGKATVSMGKTWDLQWLGGDASAFYQWPDDRLTIAPGEERVWIWDQRVDQCYGECQNVRAGDPAPAGRYEVTATIGGDEFVARFSLGEYFVLKFRTRPAAEFVVFVASQPEVDQMRQEAERPVDEKRLIVSGIVRGPRRFNPEWKFSMGANKIVLGESFIEVCDGSPYYVQRHREEWYGERWCPWSGYVDRVR